jgi:hypothetical protein
MQGTKKTSSKCDLNQAPGTPYRPEKKNTTIFLNSQNHIPIWVSVWARQMPPAHRPKNRSLFVHLFFKYGNDFPKLSPGRCGEQRFSGLWNRNLKQGGSRTHTTKECDFSHTKATSHDKCVR